MQKFTSTIPAHVREIVFMDDTTIEDVEILFFGEFLIVSESENDEPCFYNVATIKKLVGVKEIRPRMRVSSI